MTKKMSRFLAAALSLIMLLACAAGALADETVYLTKVNITPASVTLTIGGSEDLSVTVEPYNTTQTAVLFSSSNTMVATVNSAGRVTGVSAGFAVIYATSVDNPYMIAACSVTVLESTKVSMNYSSLFLSPGFTSDLTATVTPYEIASQGVRFSSSNPSVAVVSNDGSGTTTVTAVGAGTATIYATAADGTMGTTSVTVGTKVNKISVKPTSITINTGSQTSVSASVEPANASNTSVKWSSSDTNVATVDSYGNVTTWCAGSAAIIATAQDGTGLTASCYIEVKGVDVTHPPTAVPTATPVPTLAPGTTATPPPNGAKASNIASGSLNLRATASQNGKRIASIPKGGTFYVLEKGSKWCRVWYKGIEGYVMTVYVSSFATFTPTPAWMTPTPSPVITPEPGAPSGDIAFAKTASGSLNLRATASSSGRILARIPQNANFTLIRYGDTWSEAYYKGNRGYVMSKFVGLTKATATPTSKPATLVTATPVPLEGSKARVTVKAGELNLRSAASQSSSRVRLIPNNAIIDILQYGKDWCYASYNGSTGYVMTKFLVLGTGVSKSGSATAAPSATVPVSSGTTKYAQVNTISGGLNLRKGAGLGYARVTIIPKNAYVTIVTEGTTWTEVTYNGATGYVQTIYLKKL